MTSTQYLERSAGVTIFGTSPLTENHFNIPNEVITQIACGDKHCLIVCESGRVFGFGDNSKGQCGLDPKHGKIVKSPAFVESLGSYKIVQVACGAHSSFFVTSNGELFVCGSNQNGELGLGHERPCALPERIGHSLNIKSISASGFHFMIITDTDVVHVCGDNWSGQLGLGHQHTQRSLTNINFPEKIVRVVCGETFNIAVSVSGKLYTANKRIVGEDEHDVNLFREIICVKQKVLDVACGNCHAVLIAADGTVWGFGGNFCGQLGTNNVKDNCTLVKAKIPDHLRVKSVFAGKNRSALISEGGDVYLWGGGHQGVLGQSVDCLTKPVIVNKAPRVKVDLVAFCVEFTVLLCTPKPMLESNTLSLSSLSKLEESVISSLQCPVCLKIMCTPIHMCNVGHSVCSVCKPKINACPQCRGAFSTTRNFSLETLCVAMRLPCVQCSVPLPMTAVEPHLMVCPARERNCPLKKECSWMGNGTEVEKHVMEAHADCVWIGSPQSFEFSDTAGQIERRAWKVNENVFIVYWKYDGQTRDFKAAAKQIGTYKLDYKLGLTVISDDKINTYYFNISVDTDCIDDIFATSTCFNSSLFKNVCKVVIVERGKFVKLAEEIEAAASMQKN